MDLDAAEKDLNSLLAVPGEQFRVPEYQRPYAWSTEHIDELWEDVLGSGGETYFMGSIVLNVENKVTPQIIDGQQRLTSLVLLLSLIRDRYAQIGSGFVGQPEQLLLNAFGAGDKGFKFRSGDAIWPVLRDFVLRQPTDDLRRRLSDLTALDQTTQTRSKQLVSNLKRLAFHLDAHLESQPSAENALYNLEQHIRTGLAFVVIKVGNVSDAFRLFETLNDRGLQLSAADLLKSHVLSEIARTTPDDDAVGQAANRWDAFIDSLQGVDVIRFLRHYLLMSRTRVRKHEVFDFFKEEVKSYGAPLLLDRLNDFAVCYGSLLKPVHITGEAVRDAVIDIGNLPGFSHYVVLLPARRHLDDPSFVRVCRLTEALSFRWTICGRNAQELETLYSRCAEILEKSSGAQVAEVERNLVTALPPDDEFKARFASQRMGTQSIARYALRRIEEEVFHRVGELKGASEVHIEHVMPQTATPSWAALVGKEDSYDDVVSRWGNLTLLHSKPNVQMSNRPFAEKRPHFERSELEITRTLAAFPTWDPSAIGRRQEWLAKLAAHVWSPDALANRSFVPPPVPSGETSQA